MRTNFLPVVCVILLGASFAARQASAQNLLQNPGFETGDLSSWTVLGSGFGVGVSVRTGDNGPSAGGTHSAFASNLVTSANLTLQQSTAAGSVVPGAVNYSFDLKNILAVGGGTFTIQISDLNSSGGVIDQGPGLLQPSVPIDGNWHTISGTFTAPANVDHLQIAFNFTTPVNLTTAVILRVDNVSLSQVPEPTAAALVVLGLFGCFVGQRKRRFETIGRATKLALLRLRG